VIVRQMMRKLVIEDPGDTKFLEKQIIDKLVVMAENDWISQVKREFKVAGMEVKYKIRKNKKGFFIKF
jgi:hypothetical protein